MENSIATEKGNFVSRLQYGDYQPYLPLSPTEINIASKCVS